MGFSGGGSNVLKPHKHSSAVQDGSPLDMNNVTEATLTAGDIVYSDGAALQRLPIGANNTILVASGSTPSWSATASNPLIKVTKTFSDIAALEMDIYTLPQDAALVNVYTDITTVFDVSTAVTIGDAGDDNGFQEATDWTSGLGLTDATRGAIVTSFKTMRSTSGTTAIKAYNFSTTGGGGSTFSQSNTDDYEDLNVPVGKTEIGQSYQTGQVLVGQNVCKASWFLKRVGATTGTLRAYIRQTDGTLIATSSTTLDASTLTTGYIEYEFEFADVGILNDYQITINSDDLLTGQVHLQTWLTAIANGIPYQKIAGVWSIIGLTRSITMNVEYACTPATGDTQGVVDFYLQVVD